MRSFQRKLWVWALASVVWCLAIWVQFQTLKHLPIPQEAGAESLNAAEASYCVHLLWRESISAEFGVVLPSQCKAAVEQHN